MFVQLNRASLAAVNTLVHYIFICRAVTLMFPVTESKHHNSVEEGPFDCKEAELCQAVQKSRSVGHLCKPEQNESLTPVRLRAPSAREAISGNSGSRGLDAKQLHPREQEDSSKNRVKLVFSADAGRVKDGPERIPTSVAQERKRILDVCCPEQRGAQIWRACSYTDLDSKCIT